MYLNTSYVEVKPLQNLFLWPMLNNLNTSYVEVKLENTFVKVSVKKNLNTSYVEVKRIEEIALLNQKYGFKYILCWS